LVEDLAPSIEQAGLVKDHVQVEVERSLRNAGIKALTQEECLKTPGEPYLYIILNLNPIRSVGEYYSYSIDIGVIQNVAFSGLLS